jgi:hypothetical protein
VVGPRKFDPDLLLLTTSSEVTWNRAVNRPDDDHWQAGKVDIEASECETATSVLLLTEL